MGEYEGRSTALEYKEAPDLPGNPWKHGSDLSTRGIKGAKMKKKRTAN